MKQIASAFIKAKIAFAPAMKASTNPHFKSKYADLAACVEAVDDAFLANGIVMYQETSDDQTGVTVETVLMHESGEVIRCGKLHVPASKQDPQGYGSALTYARRYSLMAACGIAPEDDDGNSASKTKANVQAIKPASAGSVSKSVWDSLSPDEQRFLDGIAVEAIAMIDAGQTGQAIAFLTGKHLDADEKAALNSRFTSAQRSAMKQFNQNELAAQA
jgi:hypothetical protein